MKALCGVPASNAKWGEVAGIVTECKLKRYQEKTKSSIKVPNYYLSGYILKRGIFRSALEVMCPFILGCLLVGL